MGRRRTDRLRWTIGSVVPSKTAKIRAVFAEGKLVAWRMTGAAIALLSRVRPAEMRFVPTNGGGIEVGVWLGVRVFLDVRELAAEKARNLRAAKSNGTHE